MTMHNEENSPATKSDLNTLSVAMQADVRELEYKFDLKIKDVEISLRSEIKAVRRDLAIEITKTNLQMEKMEERLSAKMDAQTSHITGLVERMTFQWQKVDRDQIITRYRVDELEKRVKSLETH